MRGREGLDSRAQPREPSGAPFIESNGSGAPEQPQADRADPAIGLGHPYRVRDQSVDPVDGTFEEGEVALAEGARWKKDFDTAEMFSDVGLSREVYGLGAEDGIAAFGLGVEEESL